MAGRSWCNHFERFDGFVADEEFSRCAGLSKRNEESLRRRRCWCRSRQAALSPALRALSRRKRARVGKYPAIARGRYPQDHAGRDVLVRHQGRSQARNALVEKTAGRPALEDRQLCEKRLPAKGRSCQRGGLAGAIGGVEPTLAQRAVYRLSLRGTGSGSQNLGGRSSQAIYDKVE